MQQPQAKELQGQGEFPEIDHEAAGQGAQHHAPHAPGVEFPEAPGGIGRILFKQQDVQGLAKERQAQAEAPKDRQKGPETIGAGHPPKADGGARQAQTGEDPGRITVADHPHGKGHQDGVQVEDGVEQADLAAGEVEPPLQIQGQKEVSAGDDRGENADEE